MLNDKTEETRGEKRPPDQPDEAHRDPILERMKYPKGGGYRVKHEKGELVVEEPSS